MNPQHFPFLDHSLSSFFVPGQMRNGCNEVANKQTNKQGDEDNQQNKTQGKAPDVEVNSSSLIKGPIYTRKTNTI